MLGNFSFGDYFKLEACEWAWEYFTQVLQIPAELLWVSVYEQDDEARSIWIDRVGVAPERIVKFGKADNFWEHGSGPCGPCSEIYIDRGADKTCEAGAGCKVGCDCDRYIEVWNLVFTQFDNDGKGNYSPLANKNIDTGMGLERLACIMQGANNMFEVDTIKDIITEIEHISSKKYTSDENSDISFRVITDHVRACTFMICDGVLPSNEGRGYVLRRLLRRAARHGRLIGIEKPFLFELCDKVIQSSKNAYPQLSQKQAYIKNTVQTEEKSFAKTVGIGMELLNGSIAENIAQDKVLSGDIVFKLHDTYGFPVDLTREILGEKAMTFDEDRFNELMQVQKDTARANQAFKGGWSDENDGGKPDEALGFRNHSATHMLHAALHKVVGEHANQAGSLPQEHRLRFDFTHAAPLSEDEIKQIETTVNEWIISASPVTISEMSLDEAVQTGAAALFGEKYGDRVRVVKMGDFSAELCGGTHVSNTGEVGLFKIVSESGIASGVRRIEAVTGFGVLDLIQSKQDEINQGQEKLKQAGSAAQKEITRLNTIIANIQAKSAEIKQAGEVNGIRLYTQKIPGADANAVRQAADRLQSSIDDVQGTIILIAGEKNFFCVCGEQAVAKGFHAGNIVREAAGVTGGKGGGKPDSAMAGIGDTSKIDEALEQLQNICS
jgi:alanyl-tRNA synthetase